MERKYNIKEFIAYANLKGYKNSHIHLADYSEHQDIRRTSGPVQIDFYFLAIKLNFDKDKFFGQTAFDQADSFAYLDQPNDMIQWNIESPISGYHILIEERLFKKIAREYSFTHYRNHEALFITKEEEKIITDLFRKAYTEYRRSENFSRDIIVSYAALILSYIQNFYSRQFESRKNLYNKTVADFYKNLEDYYESRQDEIQMPSVSHFADLANLSSNYFGDVIKHFTGHSPQEHIHQHVIQMAKHKLRNTQLTISEIAYSLGFEYPSYFTTFFKNETGISPSVFRNQ